MSGVELPAWVEQRLRQYEQRFKIPYDELKQKLLELYNLPFVQQDPQFKSDDMRFTWCLDVLHARLVQQKNVREYTVIPYGASDVRITKQGPVARLYAIIVDGNQRVNGVILFRGQLADAVKDVQLYYAYRTKLMRSPSGTNVFVATTFTRFEDGQPLPDTVENFITNYLGIRKILIAESAQNLSRRVGDKFVDEFDLRAIEGVVLRYSTGKRPSGSDWAVYVVTDGSVTDDVITPDGYIIPSQFTVWVPAFMLRYAEDSKLLFVGTLSPTSSREIQMNAIYVHPIVSIPITR